MPIPSNLLSNFKYRIDLLKPGESAIFKWPDIAAYSDVFAADDIDYDPEVVMKFLILCYTPNSPAYQQQNHVGKRKTLIMKWLDIEPDEFGHYGEYNNMLLLRDDDESGSSGMRNRFVTFLRIQHSTDWAIMCHAQEEMEFLMKLKPTTDVDEVMKRRKLVEECRSQLEEARNRITNYERSATTEGAIQWFSAQRNSALRPEVRLNKLKASVPPEQAKVGVPIKAD